MPSHTTPVPAFHPLVYAQLLAAFKRLPARAVSERWLQLEAAHVVGQTRFLPHLETHWLMLGQAWRQRQTREMAGQLMRLVLVPLGHLTGRLPIGNPGRSDVSAFRPMALRDDIIEAIARATPTIP